jgi:hypothetical protein
MKSPMRAILFALALCGLGAQSANAAGTTPLALQQEIDINGQPLAGCLLYFFVAGTVATPQNSYQDFGLTTLNPNPLTCDQTGRIPMHWLADGLIHFRLTTSAGLVVIDNTLQTLGPSSSGGGGGGGGVDPTSVASTGDIKFRPTSEVLTGWVIMNGTTIGNATSGATQRANATDTLNLFVYLWTNCTNAHCPVSGGRGVSALADFNNSKQMTLPDWRDSMPVGRDCMNTTCAGGLLSSNVTSGGGDGVDTPGASGGDANQTIALTNLPALSLPVSASNPPTAAVVTGGIIGGTSLASIVYANGGNSLNPPNGAGAIGVTIPSLNIVGSAVLAGSGAAFSVMNPFKLGTWYQKL